MFELHGKYAGAKVYAKSLDSEAIRQIMNVLNTRIFEGQTICIMPDGHGGKGCVIGFTATMGSQLPPNLVGYDIGCGVLICVLSLVGINFEMLEDFIKSSIPYGNQVNSSPLINDSSALANNITRVCKEIDLEPDYHLCSLGTLGGGNHFIEVNCGANGNIYIVIHSGSRNFGKRVCEHHQQVAENYYKSIHRQRYQQQVKEIREQCKGEEIERRIHLLKEEFTYVPTGLEYLEGAELDFYLNHMAVAQNFASINRFCMMKKIIKHLRIDQNLNFQIKETFETVHNYFDFEDGIVRKGAISAHEEEKVLIPLNMEVGSIVAVGKGNPEWNYSLPHGAGRLMSRGEAKRTIDLEEAQERVKHVWTRSLKKSSLDEAPQAYKSPEEILEAIEPNGEILEVIPPLYCFKDSEEEENGEE